MNKVSLRKLSLFSFSMLTLCFASLTNVAHAAAPSMEDAVLIAQQRPSTRPLSLRDTQALTLSINTINTFELLYSEARRAGAQPNPDPVLQRQLVCELRQLLTKEFSYTSITTQTLTATDFNSLLALIQQESASITFHSGLEGNLSLESLTRDARGRRTLQIAGLRYTIDTMISGQSYLFPDLGQFTVVETSPGIYKIQTLVRNTLTKIPFGAPT